MGFIMKSSAPIALHLAHKKTQTNLMTYVVEEQEQLQEEALESFKPGDSLRIILRRHDDNWN